MQDVELPRQARWDDAVGTGDHVEAGARAHGDGSQDACGIGAAAALFASIFAFPGAGSAIRLMNRPSG